MTRIHRAVAGAIGACLIAALTTLGVQAGMGAFADTTSVWVTVGEPGQGLVAGSDVKARGVVIGEVGDIRLAEDRRRAVVELVVDEAHEIPERARFRVTSKTLLGEKQVEVAFDGRIDEGPFLADGARVDDPGRVVEVEDLLVSLQPILEHVEPDDLAVVADDLLGGLAGSGDDLARLVDRGAAATGALRRSLDDQEALVAAAPPLTGELAGRAPELNRLSAALVAGLPTVSRHPEGLRRLLTAAGRLGSAGAETVELTRGDLDALIADGASIVRLLGAYRTQVGETVSGLRLYGSKFEPGFTADGVRGQALRLQIMFDGEDYAAPICEALPAEAAEQAPGCGAPPAGRAAAGGPGDLGALLRAGLEGR